MASECPHPTQATPADAATLVIVDDSSGAARILMGRRRPTQVFLPDKFVFPGGRIDPDDHLVPASSELAETETAKLLVDMKDAPSRERARALALAAIRETFEEAGLAMGVTAPSTMTVPDAPPLSAPWQAYLGHGVLPELASLRLLARAITPTGRPRRYDTRFFVVSARLIAHATTPPDDELSELGWFTIPELRRLDLPNITRAVVEDLAQHLAAAPDGPEAWGAPYYHLGASTFERVLITCDGLVRADAKP